jgi:hypothetical protein
VLADPLMAANLSKSPKQSFKTYIEELFVDQSACFIGFEDPGDLDNTHLSKSVSECVPKAHV